MDFQEAWNIFHEYYRKKELTELDRNAFIEASELLIYHHELDDCERQPILFNLASFYYDGEVFSLAKKYFSMLAEEYDDDDVVASMAHTALAKFYYYGHDGAPDYGKAYEHNRIAAAKDPDSLVAKVLELAIAKHGYGDLEEDEYCDAVFDLSDEIFDRNIPGVWSIPVPEIILLVCEICLASEYEDETYDPYYAAHDLLKDARKPLFCRMLRSRNPDDLLLMKEIIDLDPLETPLQERFIYDLFWMLEQGDVSFVYDNKKYVVCEDDESEEEHLVLFEGKCYRSPLDFLRKAEINGKNLNVIADEIHEIDWI